MSQRTCVECPICRNEIGNEVVQVETGTISYCACCFHGWRPGFRYSDYTDTVMCAHGSPVERLDQQIDAFASHMPRRPIRVLELGCATGDLAARTRKRLDVERYDAIELSPSKDVARLHVDNLYEDVLENLCSSGVIARDYDLVVMSHVLEHLDDVRAELLRLKEVMAPRGAIFIEVPRASGNPSLPFDDNRFHAHFFSVSSLSRLLSDCGFDVIAVRSGIRLHARCNDAMQFVARPFDLPVWSRSSLSDRLPPDAGDAIIVWGAGGLVEMLIANFFEVARIDFFVDRDPGKRGTTVLGRPVRGPSDIGLSPRTILINSVDFADDIEADLSKLFPSSGHRVIKIGDLLE